MSTRLEAPIKVEDGVGTSPPRPDGIPKLRGEFAYSSDMRADRQLWGATVRSPHPRARIRWLRTGRVSMGWFIIAKLCNNNIVSDCEMNYNLNL